MSDTEADTEQSTIDTHRELNRYDERTADYRSSTVFEKPRRTLSNNWRKFHATRECGGDNVYYVENNRTQNYTSDKYAYDLRCGDCGHRVPEDEVLFIGGEWYREHGWLAYCGSLEALRLPADRVLELGADPSHDELVEALNLTRIEQKSSPHMCAGLQRDSWQACESCGHEVPMQFDGHCRMCYNGEWTDRMMDSLDAFERTVREWVNNSFVHRLESKIYPLSTGGMAIVEQILWRKRPIEGVPQIVVVEQRLQDDADDLWEYIVVDPVESGEWRYHEDDLADAFYDTGLMVGNWYNSVDDERLRELYEKEIN